MIQGNGVILPKLFYLSLAEWHRSENTDYVLILGYKSLY